MSRKRAALRASRLPFRTGACPAHASARHAAGQDLTPPYHLPCRSRPQSHSMKAQSLQHSSVVWHITERHGVMLLACERIRAASMRARASRMAAAGREHAESLTSPLFATVPLDECSLTSICGMASTEQRRVRLSARETVRATSMRAHASRMTADSKRTPDHRGSWDECATVCGKISSEASFPFGSLVIWRPHINHLSTAQLLTTAQDRSK